MTEAEQTKLEVDNPVPCPDSFTGKSWFALYIPKNLSAEEDFDCLRRHIEFRRKCMNQGFDNLLELLAITEEYATKDTEASTKSRPEPKEASCWALKSQDAAPRSPSVDAIDGGCAWLQSCVWQVE